MSLIVIQFNIELITVREHLAGQRLNILGTELNKIFYVTFYLTGLQAYLQSK